MSQFSLSNGWLFGYSFFVAFISFCNSIVAIRSMMMAYIIFPLKGSWIENEISGGEYCKAIIAPLL